MTAECKNNRGFILLEHGFEGEGVLIEVKIAPRNRLALEGDHVHFHRFGETSDSVGPFVELDEKRPHVLQPKSAKGTIV